MVESVTERSERRLRLLAAVEELRLLPELPVFEVAVLDLIEAAKTRTLGGDNSGSGREMYIKAEKQKLFLRVRDDRVTANDTGDMSTGLYVFGLSLDSKIDIEERSFAFMFPRDIIYIDDDKVEEVEAQLSLDVVGQVTEAIKNGDKITKEQFYKQHNDHVKKLTSSRTKSTK